MKKKYLTKSLFKLALECPTKLFYTKKKEYVDKAVNDSFLESLAEGGFQVGELAKFYYCDDPAGECITIDYLSHDEAFDETNRRIEKGENVIAEAAVLYDNYFIRVDIFRINRDKKEIDLIEVKAKSYNASTVFFSRKKNEITGIRTEWRDYIYDIAFQKYVTEKAFPGYRVNPFLMLVDKDSIATINGMNQLFKIEKIKGRTNIKTKENLKRPDLGEKILCEINVEDEVDWCLNNPLYIGLSNNKGFEDTIRILSRSYINNKKIETDIGSKCRECQFMTDSDEKKRGLLSGFEECWKKQTPLSDDDLKKPLVLELWCGKSGNKNFKQELINNNKYLLTHIDDHDIKPINIKQSNDLSPHDRRILQIDKIRNEDPHPYLAKEELVAEMNSWKWPLHFIDFETAAVAIPFTKNRRPYEQIAFQFSHHQIGSDGKIEHRGQFLSVEPGVFPNYDFLKALKKELENDNGTIFRYHNHENTILVEIMDQLLRDSDGHPEKDELISFIREITHISADKSKNSGIKQYKGNRDMVDMYDIVLKYFYSPKMKGSNSIKQVLPAVISHSDHLKEKYSKNIYGKTKSIKSLNFEEHIWINEKMDPYGTLPKLFEDYDEDLDSVLAGMEEIKEGGAALTAYSKLQFENIPRNQRDIIKGGLLKYCELDTLAMVMIWEYWDREVKE